MTTPEATARRLVRNHLDGRSMDALMFDAVVWMAHKRLTGGQVPTLNRQLCDDIDSQASAVHRISLAPGPTPSSHTVGADVITSQARLRVS